MSSIENNLRTYNSLRSVPQEAKKSIAAGRLKGFTDINPMWRIKKLTEEFGPCGTGWYIKVLNFWTEDGCEGEKAVFCHLELYLKIENEWSAPVVGIGGSTLVAKEKNGLRTNDEAYKMAYTDAISIACKALGMGADVYFEKDVSSKYRDSSPEYSSAPSKIEKVPFPKNNQATWNSAVQFLKKGGLISNIEKKYNISEEDKKKLIAEAAAAIDK